MSKDGTLNAQTGSALSKEQAYQLADITKTPPGDKPYFVLL